MDCVNKTVNRVQKKNLCRKKANRACRNLEWKSVKSEIEGSTKYKRQFDFSSSFMSEKLDSTFLNYSRTYICQ